MKRKSDSTPRHVAQGMNTARLERVATKSLVFDPRDPRRWKKDDSVRASAFVTRYADRPLPITIDGANRILVGGVFVEAALQSGVEYLVVVRQHGLDDTDTLLFSVAANKLLSLGSWDGDVMEAALREFEAGITDFSSALIGFAPGELDHIVGLAGEHDGADEVPPLSDRAVSSPGTMWLLGQHRLLCGDATEKDALAVLMAGKTADMAMVDPPFGCPVDGFVSRSGRHREFVEASGEKTKPELLEFFRRLCAALEQELKLGGLAYLFIDWRSLGLLQQAGEEVFGSLLQFCVWSKDRAGQGSFYRSQHELVLVFRKNGAPHLNNIQLGKHGRNRSNVWSYPSAASSRKGREKDMLEHHPTPKSVEMIGDAILDCTARGEIVLDTCLGSGTTLVAAERTNRICYAMDLDPLYVDLAVRRWQEWTGRSAIDAATGKPFDELAASLEVGETGDE